MGKASRKKKEAGETYYIVENKTNTIRKIVAINKEKAIEMANDLFGVDSWYMGKLPHAKSKAEVRADEKLTEDFAGKIGGPTAKQIVKVMHELDRKYR